MSGFNSCRSTDSTINQTLFILAGKDVNDTIMRFVFLLSGATFILYPEFLRVQAK